jgi:hypothetical protein
MKTQGVSGFMKRRTISSMEVIKQETDKVLRHSLRISVLSRERLMLISPAPNINFRQQKYIHVGEIAVEVKSYVFITPIPMA